MNLSLRINEIKVLAFYPYATYPRYIIAEYENRWNGKSGDKHVKDLFERVLAKAEQLNNTLLMDNKIAFKILFEPTNTILYVAYKDDRYVVCLDVEQEYGYEKIIEETN